MYRLTLDVFLTGDALQHIAKVKQYYRSHEELEKDVNNQLLKAARSHQVHGRLYVGKTVWRANELIDATAYFAEVPADYGESQAVS
ncbi:hypothetical protein A0U40_12475 [[Bacillus] sp. KCTC 13219]|nr:hypothetical protein A0U40_12475 [[Bacillus] sp. KCTC 13219]